MSMILGGGLIAAGLLLLRMANKQPESQETNVTSTSPSSGPENKQPESQETNVTSTSPSSGPENPSSGGQKQPPYTRDQIAFENDPEKQKEMIDELREYYRDLYPDSSDKEINDFLESNYGVKFIVSDSEPKGKTLKDDDSIVDAGKPKQWNEFVSSISKFRGLHNIYREKIDKLNEIDKNKDTLMAEGVYEERRKKFLSDIELDMPELEKWRKLVFSTLDSFVEFLVKNRDKFYGKKYDDFKKSYGKLSFDYYLFYVGIPDDVYSAIGMPIPRTANDERLYSKEGVPFKLAYVQNLILLRGIGPRAYHASDFKKGKIDDIRDQIHNESTLPHYGEM